MQLSPGVSTVEFYVRFLLGLASLFYFIPRVLAPPHFPDFLHFLVHFIFQSFVSSKRCSFSDKLRGVSIEKSVHRSIELPYKLLPF